MKKIQKILTAVSFSVVLAVFTVVGFYSFFDKDEKVSEMENRNLAQKPSFSASSYFSGDFASKFEEYYNDQFPGRNGLVKISNKIKSFYSFLKIGDGATVITTEESATARRSHMRTKAMLKQQASRPRHPPKPQRAPRPLSR